MPLLEGAPMTHVNSSTVVVDKFDRAPLDLPDSLLVRLCARWSADVIVHVPGFRYWALPEELRSMRNPKNITGHQQRAFDFYWACRACVYNGKIGLGLGTTEIAGICTLGTDKFCGVSPDPSRYGESYGYPHMHVDADAPLPFFDNKFAAVFANHVIEHLQDPWAAIREMLRVCEPGGVVCLITPDLAYMRRGSIDPTHTYEFSADQFAFEYERVRDALPAHEMIEFNTLGNHFSFNVVMKKA